MLWLRLPARPNKRHCHRCPKDTSQNLPASFAGTSINRFVELQKQQATSDDQNELEAHDVGVSNKLYIQQGM